MNAAIIFLIVLFLVMNSRGKFFGGEKPGDGSPLLDRERDEETDFRDGPETKDGGSEPS